MSATCQQAQRWLGLPIRLLCVLFLAVIFGTAGTLIWMCKGTSCEYYVEGWRNMARYLVGDETTD